MSIQRLVMACAIALALGIFAFLLAGSLREPVDIETYNARQGQLLRLASLESELERAITRSRLELDAGALRDVVRIRKDLQEARQGLPSLGQDYPGLEQPLQAYLIAANDEGRLLDRYIEQQRSLTEGFRSLHNRGEDVLAALSKENEQQAQAVVIDLLNEITAYSIQSRPENGPQVEQAAADVKAVIPAVKTPYLRQDVWELMYSAEALRTDKDKQDGLVDRLGDVPAVKALQSLQSGYARIFRSRQQVVRQYQQILAVYTGALLIAFGLLGIRLRNSFRSLEKINVELEDTNANLEQIVESRTEDLRMALDDLREHQAQLIQSEKMASLGQMVAGVAHEINTPLGYARSLVETVYDSLRRDVQQNEETVELGDFLKEAQNGLDQIGELVSGLKDFSRIDRARVDAFDVNDGLDAALKICNSQLKGRIEVEREYGELGPLQCSPSQLNQVFLNLLTNAAQAIEDQGRITIRTEDLGTHIRIAIRDTGCGMDEQTQKNIFEPFFTTKDVGQGTGLGLSIVYRIIEDHNGSIDVSSAPGEGTEFVLLLPTARAEKTSDVESAGAPVSEPLAVRGSQ